MKYKSLNQGNILISNIQYFGNTFPLEILFLL